MDMTMNESLVNASQDYKPYSLRPETYFGPLLFGIIFIIGILGNGVLIFIVLRNSCMRNVPNIYIVSLSLGDFVLILISVPFTSTIYTFEYWPYGEAICKMNEFLQTMSLGVSVFTLTALSFERYTAIVNPMSTHLGNLSRTMATAGGMWVLSVILAVPDGYFSYEHNEPMPSGGSIAVCVPYPGEWIAWYPRVHTLVRFFVFFLVPLGVITVTYSLMAHHLVQSTYNMPGEKAQSSQQSANQVEARKKVARMVLIFVLIFCVCWAPRHIYTLWFSFNPHAYSDYNQGWHYFRIVAFLLSFINSCINPLALYLLSKQFRKHYNRYLFCCCVARHKRRLVATPSEMNSTIRNYTSTVRRNSLTEYTVMKSDAV